MIDDDDDACGMMNETGLTQMFGCRSPHFVKGASPLATTDTLDEVRVSANPFKSYEKNLAPIRRAYLVLGIMHLTNPNLFAIFVP